MTYKGKEHWIGILENMLDACQKHASKNTLKPKSRISWIKTAGYLASVLNQIDKNIMEEDIRKRLEVLEYAIRERKNSESIRAVES
jgi:hypothetical protein